MRSHVSFLLRYSISSFIAPIHRESLAASEKVFDSRTVTTFIMNGIMESHILIIAKTTDEVFLSGGAMELLVGGVYGFLSSFVRIRV